MMYVTGNKRSLEYELALFQSHVIISRKAR